MSMPVLLCHRCGRPPVDCRCMQEDAASLRPDGARTAAPKASEENLRNNSDGFEGSDDARKLLKEARRRIRAIPIKDEHAYALGLAIGVLYVMRDEIAQQRRERAQRKTSESGEGPARDSNAAIDQPSDPDTTAAGRPEAPKRESAPYSDLPNAGESTYGPGPYWKARETLDLVSNALANFYEHSTVDAEPCLAEIRELVRLAEAPRPSADEPRPLSAAELRRRSPAGDADRAAALSSGQSTLSLSHREAELLREYVMGDLRGAAKAEFQKAFERLDTFVCAKWEAEDVEDVVETDGSSAAGNEQKGKEST